MPPTADAVVNIVGNDKLSPAAEKAAKSLDGVYRAAKTLEATALLEIGNRIAANLMTAVEAYAKTAGAASDAARQLEEFNKATTDVQASLGKLIVGTGGLKELTVLAEDLAAPLKVLSGDFSQVAESIEGMIKFNPFLATWAQILEGVTGGDISRELDGIAAALGLVADKTEQLAQAQREAAITALDAQIKADGEAFRRDQARFERERKALIDKQEQRRKYEAEAAAAEKEWEDAEARRREQAYDQAQEAAKRHAEEMKKIREEARETMFAWLGRGEEAVYQQIGETAGQSERQRQAVLQQFGAGEEEVYRQITAGQKVWEEESSQREAAARDAERLAAEEQKVWDGVRSSAESAALGLAQSAIAGAFAASSLEAFGASILQSIGKATSSIGGSLMGSGNPYAVAGGVALTFVGEALNYFGGRAAAEDQRSRSRERGSWSSANPMPVRIVADDTGQNIVQITQYIGGAVVAESQAGAYAGKALKRARRSGFITASVLDDGAR